MGQMPPGQWHQPQMPPGQWPQQPQPQLPPEQYELGIPREEERRAAAEGRSAAAGGSAPQGPQLVPATPENKDAK